MTNLGFDAAAARFALLCGGSPKIIFTTIEKDLAVLHRPDRRSRFRLFGVATGVTADDVTAINTDTCGSVQ